MSLRLRLGLSHLLLTLLFALGMGCAGNGGFVLEPRPDCPAPDGGASFHIPSSLLRSVPKNKDGIEEAVTKEVTEGEDLADSLVRRAVAWNVAWALRQVTPVVEAVDSAGSIWLYNTHRRGRVGGSRGFVALRGCSIVAYAPLALYD